MNLDEVTLMFKALGDPTRRKIFEFLAAKTSPVAVDESGEVHPVVGATVGEVCCHITGSEKFSSTISFHIKELRLSGLINADKSGKFMICSVRPEAVDSMICYLQTLPLKGLDSCQPQLIQLTNATERQPRP